MIAGQSICVLFLLLAGALSSPLGLGMQPMIGVDMSKNKALLAAGSANSSSVFAHGTAAPPETSWSLPRNFTSLKEAIPNLDWTWGESLTSIIASVPATAYSGETSVNETYSNVIQVSYPKGSINPKGSLQGGAGFYAQPMDISKATNVSFFYDIFFPVDFDFNKGGKLPNIYGGHEDCSGGKDSEDCFSTRLMWRTDGAGELYLYAPQNQTAELCATPPESVCDGKYGASIGRGSWSFPRGIWTRIRSDFWLNTPGEANGGFNIWINEGLVLTSNTVRFRNGDSQEPAIHAAQNASPEPTGEDTPAAGSASSGLLGSVLGNIKRALTYVSFKRSSGKSDGPARFKGIMFETFFGGHESQWASPKDQYTYFANLRLAINP